MQHGRHARGSTSQLEFEDVITVDLPDDGYVDKTYLRAVFRDPYNYLPPRRRRYRHSPYPYIGRESIRVRRAKQSGLLAAIGALVCAVVTAAMMTEHPARNTAAEQQRTRSDIAALGAFTVASSTESSHAGSATAPTQSGTPQATSTSETTEVRGNPPGTHGPRSRQRTDTTRRHNDAVGTDRAGTDGARADGTDADAPDTDATDTSEPGTSTSSPDPTSEDTGRADIPSSGSTAGESDSVETVREFYSEAADSPADAADLLVPALLSEGLETLRTTWQSLTAVHVTDVHKREDGTVRATLTVHEPDGTQLHLTQLFSFAESGLIGHIQLLSAQRD